MLIPIHRNSLVQMKLQASIKTKRLNETSLTNNSPLTIHYSPKEITYLDMTTQDKRISRRTVPEIRTT
jgi:hypothetical protein